MKTHTRTIRVIALAAALAAGASSAFAAGQLGERFIGVGYTRIDFDDVLNSGDGASVLINMPLTKNVDLGASYSFYTAESGPIFGEGTRIEADGHEAFFSATFHFQGSKARPYVRPGIGWVKAEAESESGNSRAELDEVAYDVEAGVEIPLGDRVSVTPFVGWSDAFDSGYDGTFRYGLKADVDITKTLGLAAEVFNDDDDELTISVGALFRF